MDDLLLQVLRLSLPLVLATLAETVSERGGIVNLGLEGMMLCGALAAYLIGAGGGAARLPWAALGGVLTGMLLAAVLAWLTVHRKAPQIVAGTAIHFLCFGATGLLFERFKSQARVTTFGELALPWSLSPYVGTLLLTALLAFALFRTRMGLLLRAAGEAPEALRAAGGSPTRARWTALLVAGALAGLAGASLTTVATGQFVEGMTAGRGFLALSLVLLARWHPWGALGAGLFLGLALTLELHLSARTAAEGGSNLMVFLVRSLPYGLTLALLAVFGSKRLRPPAALGRALRD